MELTTLSLPVGSPPPGILFATQAYYGALETHDRPIKGAHNILVLKHKNVIMKNQMSMKVKEL